MRYNFLLLLFTVLMASCAAAQERFQLIAEQDAQAGRLSVDELGAVYLMSATSIERRNAVGTGVYRTSELQWGDFHEIDVTDPLRPFIHFPTTGKIVYFDNTLSIQGDAIDLFALGFDNAEWMCGSRGDGFWIWDSRNSELVRVDKNFRQAFATGNLSILLGREFHPLGMMERGTSLFVLNDDYMLHVFDMFGAWKKSIQLQKGSTWMADAFKLYIFQSDGFLQVIDTKSWQSELLSLPGGGGVFSYQIGRLYQLVDGRLRVYEIPKNGRN